MSRHFGEKAALAGIDLFVRRGEFFSLLGPSGCGKTTLLRIVAGLDQPTAGSLRIGGTDALPVPAHRRHVNTVFQSYALFPHMNVRENIEFGLRMKRVPADERKRRVAEVMELVEASPLAGRKPAQLSGGEKQRVALARAVVNQPQILLLDEPLGALDLKLRKQLQAELHRLQRRLGITFLYVTHDQDEALTLSDRIAVLNAGRIEQVGSGEELYEKPRNRFVAEFLGGCNLLPATVKEREAATVWTPLGPFRVLDLPAHAAFTVAFRPEKVILDPAETAGNCFSGKVSEARYNGSETHYVVEAAGERVRVTVLNSASVRRRFRAGDPVRAQIPPEALVILAD